MYPVELHGQQVVLREFAPGDLADSLHVVGDDAVTRWLSFDSRSEDQARVMLDGILDRARQQPRSKYYLAVELPADQAVIGFARLGLAGVRRRSSDSRSGTASGAMATPPMPPAR